jgi:hypothetical protein
MLVRSRSRINCFARSRSNIKSVDKSQSCYTVSYILRCLLKLGRNLEAVEDAKKAVERARYSIVALDALGIAFFL